MMTTFFNSENFWGMILFVAAAILTHLSENSFLKEKIRREEDFKNFVEENKNGSKMKYNIKKTAMEMAESRYNFLPIFKWLFIFGAILALYRLVI